MRSYIIYRRKLSVQISPSSKVVVASDQHLGYANSQVDTFLGFLDSLSQRNDIGNLVILGDYIDMWRRDVSGLLFAEWRATQKLVNLSSKMKVTIVAGNHDYHLLQLKDHDYPFDFLESYAIPSGGLTYIFKHGWEFDYAQQPPIMELLCYNLSDDAGADRTKIYNAFTGLSADLKRLFDFHGSMDKYLDHLMKKPEDRLQDTSPSGSVALDEVEKRALASITGGERLVFGHTHKPFVTSDGRVANSGSWVSDAPTFYNTYVELDSQSMRLFRIDAYQKINDITQMAVYNVDRENP